MLYIIYVYLNASTSFVVSLREVIGVVTTIIFNGSYMWLRQMKLFRVKYSQILAISEVSEFFMSYVVCAVKSNIYY